MHIDANGLRLWVEVDGPDDGEAILLNSPVLQVTNRWPVDLVDGLVAEGYRVIRFDHRDWGRSEIPEGPYDLADLAADAAGVLDALDIDRAHIFGQSMGGMVAQILAIEYPQVVRSLALMATTPEIGHPDLPEAHPELIAVIAHRFLNGPPKAKKKLAIWILESFEEFAGSRFPFESEHHLVHAVVDAEDYWQDHERLGEAIEVGPSRMGRLGEITAPTFIVHGGEDHVFQPPHATELVCGIPDATLWMVAGLGHEFPNALVPEFLRRYVNFLQNLVES